ncbi:hypothetical protein F5Y00DRAFT_222785 [Daldinia vernicosa]|uniref:uncharacterized protein n=1 Tax=Daldinia vernicosa TaxID=114800 RepID=UPI0020080279|nr:uncharacterized protein F5Y00DRAFT_222785 [Daldinia vernicosa]KAI0854303.1 hypothetical protein F5Y00DRAFT_222785 [Daldinia vernicosa]
MKVVSSSNGHDAAKLREPYKLNTGFLSRLENDPIETSQARPEKCLNIPKNHAR